MQVVLNPSGASRGLGFVPRHRPSHSVTVGNGRAGGEQHHGRANLPACGVITLAVTQVPWDQDPHRLHTWSASPNFPAPGDTTPGAKSPRGTPGQIPAAEEPAPNRKRQVIYLRHGGTTSNGLRHSWVAFKAELETSDNYACIPCPQSRGHQDRGERSPGSVHPPCTRFPLGRGGELLHNSTHMIGTQTCQLHLYNSALPGRQHVAKQQQDQSLCF